MTIAEDWGQKRFVPRHPKLIPRGGVHRRGRKLLIDRSDPAIVPGIVP